MNVDRSFPSISINAQIIVRGIVQGVGFRPYVYSLADGLGLKGFVTNTADGFLIDIEGKDLSTFIRRLSHEAPPLSRITDLSISPLPNKGYRDFTIHKSTDRAGTGLFTHISPDVSICDDCSKELLDPRDRRYLYPFINCTNCGPRYSITRAIPYDRPNTSMAGFAMCPECLSEYNDPKNRRFHAQPNACAACGPEIQFVVQSSEFGVKGAAALQKTITSLKQGGIMAIKGLGGFHIACDAMNDDAVSRLRANKRKSNKPFAVMVPSVEAAEQFCTVSDAERGLLVSNRRPIVLLRKKDNTGHFAWISESVAPNNQYIGCMLPYTPLHHLLFYYPDDRSNEKQKAHFQALVMTSGNLSEEPIVRDNDEAIKKLSGIVDAFLTHNRDIFMRVDDSFIRMRNAECGVRNENSELRTQPPPERFYRGNSELSFIRRSRGYSPEPIALHDDGPEVLGCGADLKNTFTLTKGSFAIPSQHIGDMENYETVRFYEETLENLKSVYRVDPVAIAHDLHPGYLSTRWAMNQGSGVRSQESGGKSGQEIKRIGIQHHYAHIGSVMAENGLRKKVIGVAFDGTGY